MRIVAFVKGLFGLVDSQESGRGLSDLSETMVATLDVNALLGLGRLKEDSVSALTGPSGQPVPIFTVPADKVWCVRAWGARFSTDAATTAQAMFIGVRLSNLTGAGTLIANLSDGIASAVSTNTSVKAENLPLYLPPGAILCAFGNWGGGNPAISSHILYEEIEA